MISPIIWCCTRCRNSRCPAGVVLQPFSVSHCAMLYKCVVVAASRWLHSSDQAKAAAVISLLQNSIIWLLFILLGTVCEGQIRSTSYNFFFPSSFNVEERSRYFGPPHSCDGACGEQKSRDWCGKPSQLIAG